MGWFPFFFFFCNFCEMGLFSKDFLTKMGPMSKDFGWTSNPFGWHILVCLNIWVPPSAGEFTLHMTGYAPAYTKSVEKGSFLDIRWRRRLLQKGIFFAANRTLGVLKWVELFRAKNGIRKQHFKNLCKIVKKKYDMRFFFMWKKIMKCDTSSSLFQFKKSFKAIEC